MAEAVYRRGATAAQAIRRVSQFILTATTWIEAVQASLVTHVAVVLPAVKASSTQLCRDLNSIAIVIPRLVGRQLTRRTLALLWHGQWWSSVARRKVRQAATASNVSSNSVPELDCSVSTSETVRDSLFGPTRPKCGTIGDNSSTTSTQPAVKWIHPSWKPADTAGSSPTGDGVDAAVPHPRVAV